MNNMKKLLFIILIIGLWGCERYPEKPFVITSKRPNGEGISEFYYVGKNGYWNFFTDSTNKYNIGDTIK